jgi:hypothetical protein
MAQRPAGWSEVEEDLPAGLRAPVALADGPKLRLRMTGRRVHRSTAIALSVLMTLIGVVLLVQAVDGHGGVLSARALLGVLFLAAGMGRLYVERRRGSGT